MWKYLRMTLPRIYQIAVEMDRRARAELEKAFSRRPGQDQLYGTDRDNLGGRYPAPTPPTASKWRCCTARSSTECFHDYYLFKPQAFKNVTNGTPWLLASNPGPASRRMRPLARTTAGDASA